METKLNSGCVRYAARLLAGQHLQKIFLLALISCKLFSQNDSLSGFDFNGAAIHASRARTEDEKNRIMIASQRAFINGKYFSENGSVKNKTTQIQSGFGKPASNENLDFENNSTNGWNVQGDYEIVSSGKDTFGGFPKVYPGAGKYSLKLNNSNVNNKLNFLGKISRNLNIQKGQEFYNLHFAIVILDFPHDSAAAARFQVHLYDSANNVILCPKFNCYYEYAKGPMGVNNFLQSNIYGVNTWAQNFNVTYAPWQTVGLNLSPFIGQKIRIEITCDWCIYEVDWAYCYLDLDCNMPTIAETKCVPVSGTISSSPGYYNFKWYEPGKSLPVSSSRTVQIKTEGIYTLQCNQSKSCDLLVFTYLYNIKVGPNAGIISDNKPCSFDVKFFDKDSLSIDKLKYLWTINGVPTNTNSSFSYSFTNPGYSLVRLSVTGNNGCKDTSSKGIFLTAPVKLVLKKIQPANLYNQMETEYQASCYYPFGPITYQWKGENYYKQNVQSVVLKEGRYVVTVSSNSTYEKIKGCSDSAIIYVDPVKSIPNIFTPNNDGVNDYLFFRLDSVLSIDYSVFDRWGNKVFVSDSSTDKVVWDGKNQSGKDCSDGLFYYILNAKYSENDIRKLTGNVFLTR